jgi:hypothetical protein
MRVDVSQPWIADDTVVFSWTQSEPNPFQETNSFFFRYEAIDLGVFPPGLLLEVFLGLQLKVWALHDCPVEIVLPLPIPTSSFAFWQAYHRAWQVSMTPLLDDTIALPWRIGPVTTSNRRSSAVFFGGGKDSLLTTCLLSEVYGVDDVVAVQFVIPRRRSASHAERMERRQETLMLQPVRQHLGVATQRVWTDYLANMRVDNYRARPHAELYTLGGLPALLARGVSLATVCLSWTEYGFFADPEGHRTFLNPNSRPEVLHAQSAHYRRTLGRTLTVTNLNLLFTGLSAMRLLTARYPTGFARVVSCVVKDPKQRWCYRCRKCSWYPLFALHGGAIDPDFDYDRLFRTSPHLLRMVEYAMSGAELSPSGNAPIDPSLREDHVFPMFCHIVAESDVRLIADRLSPEAYGNLLLIKALFGNRSYPGFEMVPATAIEMLDNDVARRVAAIAAEHLVIADDIPSQLLGDDTEVIYDFSVRMPTAFESLAGVPSSPRAVLSPG